MPGLLTSSRHFRLEVGFRPRLDARQVNPVGFHVLSELGGETLQELGSQIVDQTVVVPQVVVVLRAQHDSRQRIGRIVHLEPALDLVVFVAHAMGLGGGIDRGLLVVLPIVENHVLDEHRALGVKPDLEVERGVLIGRAGRLEKANRVIDEKLPFVQRRPNRRLRVEDLGHVGWDEQLTERNPCQLA